MNRSPHASDRRGSALLIVLGLLGFLMISAVAFAISMRTERAAASSYRRGLQARELLEIAFTNARIALQYHMENQADGLDPANPSTRTVERLAPFRYDGDSSTYGRLISSTRSSSSADDSIAYLLDDAVLRHIPPAFAYPVYETLEMDAPPNGSGEVHAGAATNPGAYNIDRAANWQPIDVDIPVVKGTTIATGNVADDVQTATVGRMAWAIVNLSDALDINAVGSTSQRRGIGLTGSEFAFGSISSANASQDDFDLLPSQADATEVGLPTFASGADLATYAARVDSASELTRETKGIFPYSWESALNEGGEGPFSPFTVYGFWPNEKRENESGARRHDSNSGSGSTTVIACNDVDEQMLTAGCEVETLVRETLGVSSTVGTSLARLLRDYVDTDSKPGEYDTAYDQDLYNNAIPTVENVPMLSEVAYLQDGWEDSGKIASDIQKAVKELFEGKTMKGSGSITTQSGLLKTFETEEDLSLTFPDDDAPTTFSTALHLTRANFADLIPSLGNNALANCHASGFIDIRGDIADIEHALHGTYDLTIEGGLIQRLPLFAGLTDLLADHVPGIASFTDTSSARIAGTIRNSIFHIPDFKLDGNLLSIEGPAVYDLPNDSLHAEVTAGNFKEDTFLGTITRWATVPVNSFLWRVRVDGPLSAPKWVIVTFLDRLFSKPKD